MKSKKTTRRALFSSVMALILCCAMLVGSTFAWFTDSVSSVNNVITAGNLDVELEYYDGDSWEKVTSTTNLFEEGTLWEPGHTEVVYLKVSNVGTLALKYQLGVNIVSETTGTNKAGDTFKLSDYIEFGVIETAETNIYANRDAAREAVTDSKIISAGYTKNGQLYPENNTESKAVEQYVALVVYMPEETDNDANYKTGTVAPVINLGVNLYATQVEAELDSFGPDYDKDATYIPAWDGEAGEVPEADADGVITISTAAELAAFAQSVNDGNGYNGKTIKLGSDINLGNESWTPIGSCDSKTYFQGTFDGQGYTIYNLNVDKSTDTYMYSTAGLFGWIDAAAATIKNLNVDSATVQGSHWVGVIAGYMTGEISNCTVTNATVVGHNVNDDANGDKVGGIVGYMNSGAGKLEGNTVSNSTISGYRDVAGLAGAVATTNSVKNNTVENVTVTHNADYAAAIVSAKTAVVVDDTNVAINVNVYKGTMVAEGVIEVSGKSYEVISKEGLLNVNTIIAESSTGEGRGIKVKLMVDVDLAGETWKPIDKMWIDFDGNGHTISNLTAEAWKAGFFGYLGGGSIKNLTLENVNITGSQAGAFAGSVEGTIDNCVLKGTNTITWAEKHQYDDPSKPIEAWSGIGAITGILQPCTVNATIAEGATVTLNYGAMTTQAAYVDTLTGYIGTNKGNVTNNGTITVNKSATVTEDYTLADAISDGATNITLPAGNYTLPSSVSSKTLTITGTKDTVIEITTAQGVNGANITFDGITVEGTSEDFKGLQHAGTIIYNNVTVNGGMTLYGEKVVFNNCSFTLTSQYIRTYGAKVVEFNNCDFKTEGKAILIHQDGTTHHCTVTIKDCTFDATKMATTWDGIAVAAISIDGTNGTFTVNLEGTNTANDVFNGLWQIKKGAANVTVNE